MWQYNFTYLCHADQRKDHKYIDRYKDRRGNWQYVYAEDQASRAQNARRFQEQNSTYNRVDRILNKTNSKVDSYKNIGNYRKSLQLNKDFSNTNEAQNAREAAIAKGAVTAQRNKREYSAQNYRTAIDNSRMAGAKNASEAGESDRYAREKRQNAIPSYLRNYTKGSAERQGARAKDLDDVEKRNKTSEMLKAATERQKKNAARAAQNAREAEIAKSVAATKRGQDIEKRVTEERNSREAAIQKSAKNVQEHNAQKQRQAVGAIQSEWERKQSGRSSKERIDLLNTQSDLYSANKKKSRLDQVFSIITEPNFNSDILPQVSKRLFLQSYNMMINDNSKNSDKFLHKISKAYAKQYAKNIPTLSVADAENTIYNYLKNESKKDTYKPDESQIKKMLNLVDEKKSDIVYNAKVAKSDISTNWDNLRDDMYDLIAEAVNEIDERRQGSNGRSITINH